MTQRTPLAYFYGVAPGSYVAAWPVFVVGDDPASLTFTIAVDDSTVMNAAEQLPASQSVRDVHIVEEKIRRGYITTLVRRRIHQQAFRERVLMAYRKQCALCSLKHGTLLDAAHIIPDSDPDGEPATSNGIALCKIHHAAFDQMFLGIRPDYIIEIRQDLLEETDGPMLKHGLQGLHHKAIHVPLREDYKPDRQALETRYEKFREVRPRV